MGDGDKLDPLSDGGLQAPDDQVIEPGCLQVLDEHAARVDAGLDAALTMYLFGLLLRDFDRDCRRCRENESEH